MFKSRHLLIATKHKKETVLAPLIEKSLGVQCFVPENFDTDSFGAFSGEIERKEGPVSTVRNKCLEAMRIYGYDLGIASEGSFGSHPSIPFLPANEEIVIFIDRKNDLEITANKVEVETNFSTEEIKTWKELVDFANEAQFPSHALLLRSSGETGNVLTKGITDWDHLKARYQKLQKDSNTVFVETDMRALYNPTRMKVIEKAAEVLVEKIKSCCPHCNSPGFGVTAAKTGLPCELCGSPTKSTLSHVYKCGKCSYTIEKEHPFGIRRENPMYCDICNP
ncbi:hypothetical protein RM549_03320 [Salegentibacter sp. F188]|uniref:DUF6671 domain-containing protein n=1 Tax=Autumnicola patrickiae TaxID=3075591 RepID=A0ABU3DYJ7_9FLAO|nr:DUF6671 family protein [Salegentibacter sp. F188]MDT0688796.1 hypothetical protein [Salegentibacter sp. F188]